ncbi:MAG: hypothetical protein IMW99_09640 [Firmicutes bacterium]|nr:hypothetical protein [Bacillota bacterium]
MKRTTFIIPKTGNDGKLFPTKLIAGLQQEMLEQFGGYTVREVRGAWLGDDGRTYHDESWEYTIVMEEAVVEKLVQWLEKAKDLLSQEAMWLEVLEAEARLV